MVQEVLGREDVGTITEETRAEEEVAEVGRGQLRQHLVGHAKEFAFFSLCVVGIH